ncbi:type IV toxin-antitoxin system AbiEi family antitoxin domain-containing protein [Arthrobacter cavernae]|uniref:type IV toxin-antitoxin system AbiEi family antitoxin domain-containing protein n=1 Tax=Arthrobacter cavernae TaxID=2817681 RepID=UPI001F620BA0|nr:type IV toxin-antitoxin system AbiEi family antitoxin domain-containing protein [Arthrobacter cavernae]
MDISSFMAGRGGVARRSTLLAAGITKADIASALNAGKVLRLRRGIYAVPEGSKDIRRAQSCNALLTCLSAAPHYGLWTLNPAASLHLSAGHKTVPDDSTRHGPCRHPRHPSLPVAGLADVLIHALHCLPELEALVMVQSAVARGSINQGFLASKLQGNRNARAKEVINLSFRVPTRSWRYWRTRISAAQACPCDGMLNWKALERWISLWKTPWWWKPMAKRTWNPGR